MKTRFAFMEIHISDVRDLNPTIMELTGWLTRSNFLTTQRKFNMPVLSLPMAGINVGDTVRLSYLVDESELNKCQKLNSIGFTDKGIRYEILGPQGWSLVYEDLI